MEHVQITIAKVYKKQVKTQHGMKESLSFLEEGTKNWYSSFWNGIVGKWKQGDVVEFDFKRNGNFNNIITPKQDDGGRPRTTSSSPQQSPLGSESVRLQEILKRVSTIERNVEILLSIAESQIPGGLPPGEGVPTGEPPDHTDEDQPGDNEELPF